MAAATVSGEREPSDRDEVIAREELPSRMDARSARIGLVRVSFVVDNMTASRNQIYR
jgi:hypothetical protein